jgi:mono/diheme cytochrome c family protein
MARALVNAVLLLAFVGSLGVHLYASRDRRLRNFEAIPDMAQSPAYDTLAPNPNFADGRTLQLPEPGTIARGRMPLHYGPSPEDAVRAGQELQNPFSGDDSAAQERGAFVFTNYCQMCHGPGGQGDGPMMQRGIPPSASLVAENALQMKDGQLFHVLTYGQRNMQSHAAQLTPEDRWKVILHVRSQQQQAVAPSAADLLLQALGAQAAAPAGGPVGTLAQEVAALGVVQSGALTRAAGVKRP